MPHARQLTLLEDVVSLAELAPDPGADYGEVFTRRWVVDLILDLVGFTAGEDLGAQAPIEPSCGTGAFLVPVIERVIESSDAHDRDLRTLGSAIRAFDLLDANAERARKAVAELLTETLRTHQSSGETFKPLETACLKTIAAFLNSREGGTLLIGIADDGTVHGLDSDYASRSKRDQDPRDWFQLHLANIISTSMGDAAATNVRPQIRHVDGHDICRVHVDPSAFPVDTVIIQKPNKPKETRTEFFARLAKRHQSPQQRRTREVHPRTLGTPRTGTDTEGGAVNEDRVLVRRAAGAWAAPETTSYTDEAHLQLAYARDGDVEILIPSTFGAELAATKKHTASAGRTLWTQESFLQALTSSHRTLAEDLLQRLDALEPRGTHDPIHFGTYPGGGIDLHPYCLRRAPISVWANSKGELLVYGTWNAWQDTAGHRAYEDLARLLDQEHTSTSSKGVQVADLDRDELWSATLDCALALHGGPEGPT